MSQLLSYTTKGDVGKNDIYKFHYGDAIKGAPRQEYVPAGKGIPVAPMGIDTLLNSTLSSSTKRFQFPFETGVTENKDAEHKDKLGGQNSKPVGHSDRLAEINNKRPERGDNLAEINSKPAKMLSCLADTNKPPQGNDKPTEVKDRFPCVNDNPATLNKKPTEISDRLFEDKDKLPETEQRPAEGNGNSAENNVGPTEINGRCVEGSDKLKLGTTTLPVSLTKTVPRIIPEFGPARRPVTTGKSSSKRKLTDQAVMQPPMKRARVDKTHWPVEDIKNPRIENGIAMFDVVWPMTTVSLQDITGTEAIEQCKRLITRRYGPGRWNEVSAMKRKSSRLGAGKQRRI